MAITELDAVGFAGGCIAVCLFWFTASRGNRLLLHYLKEREAMSFAVHNTSAHSNAVSGLGGKQFLQQHGGSAGQAWYSDTRLMFYSLTIFSAVAYSATTLAQLMTPATSALRKDGIESDVMSLANVAAYLSMVSAVIWTIAHGIMLEWRRTHHQHHHHHHIGSMAGAAAAGGGAAGGGSRRQKSTAAIGGATGGAGGDHAAAAGETRSSMGRGYNNMYSQSQQNEESVDGDAHGGHPNDQSYHGSSSAAGIDDIYFDDDDDEPSYPNMLAQQHQQQHLHQQHLHAGSQAPSDYGFQPPAAGSGGVGGDAVPASGGGSHVTSFSQGYGSTMHLGAQPGGGGDPRTSNLSNVRDSSAQGPYGVQGGGGGASGAGGGADASSSCCTVARVVDTLFPYRLILSVALVVAYYVAITTLTRQGVLSGANFSAGFSFLLGLICGLLAVGSTLFLCERGAVVAARRFGLALTVLFVCLIARGIAVLSPVQKSTPHEISPSVIPLIDAFAVTCVIVVLPSRQFCLCLDLN